MKVEVFKIYSDDTKKFDTVSVPSVSYESKHFPPNGKLNSDGSEITNKFDSNGTKYELGSSIRNIFLDYAPPSLIKDSSTYTAFTEDNCASVRVRFELSDNIGIDCDKFQIGFFHGTEDEQILFERKHVFDEYNVPSGETEDAFNVVYDGPAKKVFEEFGKETISSNTVDYISKTDNGSYIVDFSINFFGDSTEGTIGMLYGDLENGIYGKYDEFKSGNLFVRLYDLAGNEYIFTGFKQFTVIPWGIDKFAELLTQLSLIFYDTYPQNLFLHDDVMGKTSIYVENPNKVISSKFGLETVLSLEPDSLGYLTDLNKKIEDFDLYQDVDGIDSVGYVKAFAFLKSDLFDADTSNVLKYATYTKGSLGAFVKECQDNTRKINVDPFIPEFAEGSTFHKFCKFLEDFLNTAWCPLDKDCRIGLLEKIARISNFNDIDKIETPLLQYWAEDHGSELSLDMKVIEKIRTLMAKYHDVVMNNVDCIRYLYKNLPAINSYKGTLNSFRILFNSIGINAELIPLWRRNDDTDTYLPEYYYDSEKGNEYTWNSKITDNYYLSSHVELKIHGFLSSDLLGIASSIVKLAKSILPVVRTIEYVIVEEFSKSSNYLTLGYFNASKALQKDQNLLQCISFLWKSPEITYKPVSEQYVDIFIPQICELCSTDAASWWKGYNPTIGLVTETTVNGIRITNNDTLNPSKFFNMLSDTLKNHVLETFIDFPLLKEGKSLSETDWHTALSFTQPMSFKLINIKWDSGYFILRVNKEDSTGISRIDNTDFAMMTFVFNRTTGFCYTTGFETALKNPSKKLPGYVPVA